MDAKKYILVVEDDLSTCKLIQAVLASSGYEVVVASHGREALTKIKIRIPDLIISDVVMPQMDGFSFYKELKKNPAVANTPVIILTARGKMEDAFAVLGVDEFVAKPFVTEAFLSKVQAVIARGKVSGLSIEARDDIIHDKPKIRIPVGGLVAGGLILLVAVICFILFRQLSSAWQQATESNEKAKAQEASAEAARSKF